MAMVDNKFLLTFEQKKFWRLRSNLNVRARNDGFGYYEYFWAKKWRVPDSW